MNKYVFLVMSLLSIACTGCSSLSSSITGFYDTSNNCATEDRYQAIFNEKLRAAGSNVNVVKVSNLKYSNNTYTCHMKLVLSDNSSLDGSVEIHAELRGYKQAQFPEAHIFWIPDRGRASTQVEAELVEIQNKAGQSFQDDHKNDPAVRYNHALARCGMVGSAYEMAAAMRNASRSPEAALATLANAPILTPEEKKAIINQVYFDPAFEDAWGNVLQEQMKDACMKESMAGSGQQWTPLR